MDLSFTSSSQLVIPIVDLSCVGEARRIAARVAEAAGLSESQRGNAAIIASELATNLSRYAQRGELLIQYCSSQGAAFAEFLAVDHGPGVENPARCLDDGYSTGGTLGMGLGAIRRLSTEFDFHSTQPGGTVVLSRISDMKPIVHFGAVCRPIASEVVCGDSWCVAGNESIISALVADGLGHGIHAAEASIAARNAFEKSPFDAPDVILARLHGALSGTRGAAALVVQIDRVRKKVVNAGVGNIAASIVNPVGSKGLVSVNGIVGVQTRKIMTFESDWSDRSVLIIHSDGLKSRWTLGERQILTRHHPATIAAVLARDFSRLTDDLTVLVLGSLNG